MKVFQIQDEWSLDHLILSERPRPVPKQGEVLLRMKAASLNYRDLIVPNKGYGRWTGTLPLIPISDGVGEIVKTGGGVDHFQAGDRVCPMFMHKWISGEPDLEQITATLGGPLDGVMTEYMAVHQRGIAMVPEYLNDIEAATLPCSVLTAWSALVTEGAVRPGESVLVQGTGGVSLFALMIAKMQGAFVIVTSSSDEKLERAKALGANKGVNYKKTPDWGKAVRKMTGGDGIDHIVEVGGAKTLPQSLRAIRPGGTISMIGVISGATMEASLGMIVTRKVRLQGITVGSRTGFEAMVKAFAQHQIKPAIDRVFAFDKLRDALDYLASGAHFGKVCVQQDD